MKNKKFSDIDAPLMILDSETLIFNYNNLKEALPNVLFYYAIKANSTNSVLEILNENECCFDVASLKEIEYCKNLGISNKKLLYTHPIKSKEDIAFACKEGINTFVVDNIFEIEKIPKNSNVLLRVKTFEYDCANNLSKKFGCRIEDVFMIAEKIRNKHLNLYGLCFHVGSQMRENESYIKMLSKVKEIYNSLESLGFNLEVIDIGGGFPDNFNRKTSIYDFCSPIRESLKDFEKYKIIAEPGRFLVSDAFSLIFKIIGKSIRDNKIWYYANDGVYGSFSDIIYDQIQYPISCHSESKNIENCVLAGPTCDCIDIISENINLPNDLEYGDLLTAYNIGAYASVCSCNFNGFGNTDLFIN